MPNTETGGQPQAQEIISGLQHSFEDTLDRQRALWEQVSRVAKDESVRFTKQRLDKTSKALEKLQADGAGPQDLVAGQQEWFQDMVKDYTAQSLRYSEMIRGLTMNAFSSAISAGRSAMQKGQEMAEAGASAAERTGDAMRQSADDRGRGQDGEAQTA